MLVKQETKLEPK